MGARGILIVLVVGTVWIQSSTASQCSQQMDSFRQCVRSQMANDDDPTANDRRRQTMQNDLADCASRAGCQSPLPSSQERQAREACFTDARKDLRGRLESCVRSQDSSFKLPGDDFDKDAYWQYVLLRSFAAMRTVGDNSRNRNRNNKGKWQKASGDQQAIDICNNDDRKKSNMAQCLKDRGTFNKTSAQSKWRKNSCKIKRQCNQVSQQCQQAWDNTQKPRLCDCVNQVKSNGLRQIQDNYVRCLQRRGVKNAGNNDDGRTVIQRMLNGWCPQGKMNRTQLNQTDPCRRRGSGGRGNNGNPNNANPNNNNWNSGSSSSSSSSSNVDYPYDDGSSSSSTTDNSNVFSSFLGGSDPLSSVSSVTGGDSSGLLGGGLLSGGGGGGGLLSSFTGGNSGGLGGGLLSSFTGGGSPLGALGGGSPLGGLGNGGLLSSFTGGGTSSALDASSSLGAFGGAGDMFSGLGGDSGNLLGSLGSFGGF